MSEIKTARTRGNCRHGGASGAHSLTYKSWRNMLTRGRNKKIVNASRYVERGITVCAEWLPGGDGNGFARFRDHIGERPSPKHSLDRIDNDKGYEPGNVRWATAREQVLNFSRNRFVTYQGERMPLSLAAERAGFDPRIIRDRMRLGWPEDKLFTPRARAEFGRGAKSRPGVIPRPRSYFPPAVGG